MLLKKKMYKIEIHQMTEMEQNVEHQKIILTGIKKSLKLMGSLSF
jgi:hypothetical protein